MKVEIWSDVVCPWCYVGKRRFESALASFEHRDTVAVTWRSFELDPSAPSEQDEPVVDHLAAKYRVSRTQAEAMLDRMTAAAAAEGVHFRFDRARRSNTFDAHRVLHLAAERGHQDAVAERLMAAYFSEGEPIGDTATLARLAAEAGLEEVAVREMLAGDAYAGAVRDDEAEARRLAISGVPFFVVDRTYGVSGAQPAELLLEVLDKAWADAHPLTIITAPGDAGCTEDGCAT